MILRKPARSRSAKPAGAVPNAGCSTPVRHPGRWILLFAGLALPGCGSGLSEPNEPPPNAPLHATAPPPVMLRTEAREEAPQWVGAKRWTERETAVDALGRIGGPEALKSLVDLLHGTDDQLSIGAARALAMMGTDAKLAVPDLIAELSNPNVDVRKHVIRALGQMGPAASAAILPLTEDVLRPESAKDREIEHAREPRAKPLPPTAPLPPTSAPGAK